jgi:lipoprotein-anchoring transpeptidase ErfK/SrfK
MLECFRSVAAVALLGMTAVGMPAVVHAQGLIFDWGGEKTTDSGKQRVKFSGPGKPGDIIVSFTDRKLYFITAAGEADTYPIATPREQSRWEGITSVTQKRENPSWTPTSNMLKENPKLPRWVPGGHPMNPLGYKALYLGSSEYRIHGTDAPWTIGTAASKGCVRMFNKDVDDLYPRVKVGSKVTVTWQQFANVSKPMNDGEKLAVVGGDEKRSASATPVVAVSDDGDQGPVPTRGMRSKARAAGASQEAEKVVIPAAAPVALDEAAAKPKRVRAVVRDELSPSTPRPEAGLVGADDVQTPQKTAKVEEAASAVKPTREEKAAARKVRTKPKSIVETGSIAGDAGKSEPAVATERGAGQASASTKTATDDVVQRALAAAERAAASAERAAAAADRALAAIEQRGAAAKETPATPTATP